MARAKSSLQLVATAIALVAVIGLIWYLRQPRPTPAATSPGETAAGDHPGQATASQSAPGRPLRTTRTVPGVERIGPEQRAQLIKAIQSKRAEEKLAAATARSNSVPTSAPAAGSLDKEYLRARIKEIVPLVAECYELALAEGQSIPEVKLVTQFTIEGAAELGGVVTSSEIVNQEAEQQHPGLAECVRETMYALRLQEPSGGGVVTVTYPFKFSSGASTRTAPPGGIPSQEMPPKNP